MVQLYTHHGTEENAKDNIVVSATGKTMARIHNGFFLFQFYFQCALSHVTELGNYFTDGVVTTFFLKK